MTAEQEVTDGFRIRPDLRGRGLGQRLFNHSEAVAYERAISHLQLGVHPDNPTQHLYGRLGYQPIRITMGKTI